MGLVDTGVIDLRTTPHGRPRVVQLGGVLDPALACAAVADAAALGYRAVEAWGGVDAGVAEVLALARSLGMTTTALADGPVDRVDIGGADVGGADVGVADLVLVPVGVLTAATGGLDRPGGLGVLADVTAWSWRDLPWMAELAADRGAEVLVVRAASADIVDDVFVLAGALRLDYAERLRVECGLVHRRWLRTDPESVYAGDVAPDPRADPAGAVGTLVIEPDGVVLPLAPGLHRRLAVADLGQERLAEAWPRFAEDVYPALRRCCASVHARMLGSSQSVFDWPSLLARASQPVLV